MPFVIQDAIWLSALGFDGKIVWQKRLGEFKSMHGFAASPLVYRSLVIVAADNLQNSFLAAVHRRAPATIWKTNRPSYKLRTCTPPWAMSPAATSCSTATDESFQLRPAQRQGTLDVRWAQRVGLLDHEFQAAKLVYSSVGFPRKNMLCIRGDGSGDVSKARVVWSKQKNMAYVPFAAAGRQTVLHGQGHLGKVACFEARNGQRGLDLQAGGRISARRLSWPAGTSTWSTRKGWPSFSRLAAGSSWLPGTIWAMAALPRQ